MPIEILEDIVEEIANQLGVYGADRRSCFTSTLTRRIRAAVGVERRLEQPLPNEAKERSEG